MTILSRAYVSYQGPAISHHTRRSHDTGVCYCFAFGLVLYMTGPAIGKDTAYTFKHCATWPVFVLHVTGTMCKTNVKHMVSVIPPRP